MTRATDQITQKRMRQIADHGYKIGGDKGREPELIAAANCYIQYWTLRNQNPYMAPELFGHPADQMPNGIPLWPWARDYWKPTTFEDDMILAASLLAAAVDSRFYNYGRMGGEPLPGDIEPRTPYYPGSVKPHFIIDEDAIAEGQAFDEAAEEGNN